MSAEKCMVPQVASCRYNLWPAMILQGGFKLTTSKLAAARAFLPNRCRLIGLNGTNRRHQR